MNNVKSFANAKSVFDLCFKVDWIYQDVLWKVVGMSKDVINVTKREQNIKAKFVKHFEIVEEIVFLSKMEIGPHLFEHDWLGPNKGLAFGPFITS